MRITAKNVRDAADLIERAPRLQQHDYQGWDFDDDCEPSTEEPVCWCMMGAIAHVKNPNALPEDLYVDDEGVIVNLGSAFCDAVLATCKTPSKIERIGGSDVTKSMVAHDRIAVFNDAEGRRKSEAVKKLRRIAELMERR